MFCPKCGNQIPDGSAFCGKCGNKFEDTRKPTTTPSVPAGTAASSGAGFALHTNGVGVAAIVLVIIAIITTFMPWFDISSQMSFVGGAASGLTSGLSSLAGGSGGAGNSFDFEDSYAVWTLVGLADTFNSYAEFYSAFGGSDARAASAIMGGFSWICLILWIVSMAFAIWGSVCALARGSMGLLRTGCVLLVVTTMVFYVFTGAMSSDTGTANAFPMLCSLLSIAAFVCSFVVKRKA